MEHKKWIEWINNQNVFMISDFLFAFDIIRKEKRSKEEIQTGHFLSKLKKEGYIQCCEKKGSFRQYITVSRIPITFIFGAKSKIVNNHSKKQ